LPRSIDGHAWDRAVPEKLAGPYRDALQDLASRIAVPIGITERCWVIQSVTVEIETLRISKVRIRYGGRLGRPVRRYETAEAAAVVARPEQIEA